MDKVHDANSFSTFGDLLKYLRRRARLTQLELSIAVGYSEAQISRLEQNQRLPDLTAVQALFISALHLENETELSARLLELAQSARQEDAPIAGFPPYKGLLFFDEGDAELFFGREEFTAHLVEHVTDLAIDPGNRFLVVVGASGSGKSSLVRAGLAVALKRLGWDVRVFTPTSVPVWMLEKNLALKRVDTADRVLLLVDQFEEVFTLCHDEMERVAFIEKLLSLAQDPSKKITVVIALRADFYSHCAQHPILRKAVAASQEFIGQMTVEELRCAIEEPAKRGGWELESGLVDILLHEIGAHGSYEPEPGALPLLSHALLATWERRQGRRLTLDGYHASGGVHGAIAETAESVFADQLDQTQQEIARNVFLRLTKLGDGTDDTRQRATLNELERQSGEAAQLRAVLNILAQARLITLNENSAEVAHETLIRQWRRLRTWLAEDRESLLLHRHLTGAAREWQARGRDPAELYRGTRLAQVREWAASNRERLNETELAFIDACIQKEKYEVLEHETQRQRELDSIWRLTDAQSRNTEQLRRRAVFLTWSISIIVILAGYLLFFMSQANAKATQAQSEQNIAVSRELAAAAINNLDEDPERSILLALQAVQTADTMEAQDALHRSILASRVRLVFSNDAAVLNLAYSPDGRQIATASLDQTAKIWNADNGQLLRTLTGHTGAVNSIVYSPDGKRIATSSDDRTAIVWDASTGKELFSLSNFTNVVQRATFSPDGRRLATVDGNRVSIWDSLTGQKLRTLQYSELLSDIVFSPSGERLAVSTIGYDESRVIISDVLTGEQLSTLTTGEIDPFTGIAFSPDGSRIAASTLSLMAIVWDVNTGQETTRFVGHKNHLNDIAFSPDGKWLATGSQDNTAKIWDSATGKEVLTLYGHLSGVNSVAFSPDGKHLTTGSLDGTARVWDITPAKELAFIPTDGNPWNVALNPDGTRVLADDSDNIPKIWDATSGKLLMSYNGRFAPGMVTAYSPDGTRVAAASENSPVVIWDTETGRELLSYPQFGNYIWRMAFSPDGTRIAIASAGGTATISDITNGTSGINLKGHGGPVFGIAFRPDGKQIATSSQDFVYIWDAFTGDQILALYGHTDIIWNVAYSPDGMRIGTASRDGTARIWNATTGIELFTLRGHAGIVNSIAFSPDGKWVATGSWDGTAIIWDASTGIDLLTFDVGSKVFGVSFSRDGTRFALNGGSGGVYTFVLPIDDLVTLAKSRVTRSLTDGECKQYLHVQRCPSEP